MNDVTIQEQLRDYAEGVEEHSTTPWRENPWSKMLNEGADRIDALETALRDIAETDSFTAEAGVNLHKRIARGALEASL